MRVLCWFLIAVNVVTMVVNAAMHQPVGVAGNAIAIVAFGIWLRELPRW